MSQAGHGDALGVTFQQIQKYENGKNRVSSSRLMQIAKVLKVPVSHFFKGTGSKMQLSNGAAKAIDRLAATSEGVALIRAFQKVQDPKTRRAIVDLVQLAGD